MGGMLDIVGSAIIFGVLLLTVARVQENLNTTMYQNTYNLITQTTAINIARQMEYDFTKIGYRVTGQRISRADTTAIAFNGAMTYGGVVDSIAYTLGEDDATSTNPRDYVLNRYSRLSGITIPQRIGLSVFYLTYFDTTNAEITQPITTVAQLNAIRSINVRMRFESRDPLPQVGADTSVYFAVNWEKLIYARNLGGLNLR